MKYLLKSIVTNNRDFKTGVMFVIEERYYLFGCPDGFQRIAGLQKLKFNKFVAMFLPSLHTDFYAGMPGLLLSRREGGGATCEKMYVVGMNGLQKRMDLSQSFLGKNMPTELVKLRMWPS